MSSSKLTVLDVGARAGVDWVLPKWLARVRPLSFYLDLVSVHGFEPDPEEARRLLASGEYARVEQAAIAPTAGPATLFVTREAGKSAISRPDLESIREVYLGDIAGYQTIDTIDVVCDTLDAYCERHGLEPDWIKLDVQGIEPAILRASTKALESASVLFLELSTVRQYEGQETLQEFVPFLFESGFDLVAANYKPDTPYGNDLVFVRRAASDSAGEAGARRRWSVALCLEVLGLRDQLAHLGLDARQRRTLRRYRWGSARRMIWRGIVKATRAAVPSSVKQVLKKHLPGRR